jgi:hypothetical protein
MDESNHQSSEHRHSEQSPAQPSLQSWPARACCCHDLRAAFGNPLQLERQIIRALPIFHPGLWRDSA